MNMKTDTETGLPVVPEGYFWRVVDHKEAKDRHTDGELEVQLVRKVTKTMEERVWKNHDRSWRNLWFGNMSHVCETYEYLADEIVLKKGLIEYRSVSSGIVQQYLDYGWGESYRNDLRLYDEDSDTTDKVEIFLLLEPTEANVVDVSESIFEKFVILQANQKADEEDALARAKLAGDYPPKRISNGEISNGEVDL